jgi:hypothetical protein
MVRRLGALGDRVLGLIVPRTQAAACRCWYIECELPDGSVGTTECCRIGPHLHCDRCRAG